MTAGGSQPRLPVGGQLSVWRPRVFLGGKGRGLHARTHTHTPPGTVAPGVVPMPGVSPKGRSVPASRGGGLCPAHGALAGAGTSLRWGQSGTRDTRGAEGACPARRGGAKEQGRVPGRGRRRPRGGRSGAARLGTARLGSARPGHHEPLQGVQVPAHRGPAAPQGGERRGTLPAVRYRGAGVAGPGLPAGGGGATPVRRGSGSSCCRHRRYGGVVPGSPTRCPVTVRQRRPGGPSLAPTASRPDSLSRGALQLGAGGGPQPFPGRYRPPNLARGLLRCSQCR